MKTLSHRSVLLHPMRTSLLTWLMAPLTGSLASSRASWGGCRGVVGSFMVMVQVVVEALGQSLGAGQWEGTLGRGGFLGMGGRAAIGVGLQLVGSLACYGPKNVKKGVKKS